MSGANDAMRRAKLPSGIRWMGGSIINTTDGGRTVAHGILTNDPKRWNEKRVFEPVTCEHEDEVEGAIAYALGQIEMKSQS